MKCLFLDDIRIPSDVTWSCIGTGKYTVTDMGTNWAIVRSYTEAVKWVTDNGFPDIISFDHDLGYEDFETSSSGLVVVTNSTEEKSGYDFAKWLIEHDMDMHDMPNEFNYIVHSANPVGAKNIHSILDNYIRHKR